MVSFPAEILLGIYFGLLVGTVPALVSWGVGFGLTQRSAIELPWPGAVLLTLVLASLNAGIIILADAPGLAVPGSTGLGIAVLVVAVLGLSAYNHGSIRAQSRNGTQREETGENRRTNGKSDHQSATTHTETQRDTVTQLVHITGEIGDIDGHPPLSPARRQQLNGMTYTVPTDLPPAEQESHLATRLKTAFDLGAATVTIEDDGTATVAAAPAFSHLSTQLADDRQAVSVTGLIPTGVSTGDAVTVITPNAQVRGTVIAARTTVDEQAAEQQNATAGGEGRLTVAVTRTDVEPLLRAPAVKIVVESRENPPAHDAVSVLQQANKQFKRFRLPPDSPLAGETVGSVRAETAMDATVLGLHTDDGWQFPPAGTNQLAPGDELFAAGTEDGLHALGGQQ